MIYWRETEVIESPNMHYGTMTTLELRSAALALTKKLRDFEGEMKGATAAAIQKKLQRGGTENQTEEERSSLWNKRQNEYMQLHAHYTQRFRSEMRTDSVLMYEELLKRTSETKKMLVALEYGMLAGALPLEDVAHEIEKLAKSRYIPERAN